MKLPPKVPGVGDLHSLLTLLEHAKQRDKWIADAKKVLDENLKAVKLLGAKETIQKNLDAAERKHAAAERAMENARAAAETILEDAEAQFAKRELAVIEAEKAHAKQVTEENNKLRDERAEFETAYQERTVKLNSRKAGLDALNEDVTSREKKIDAREKRADKKLADAREIKAEAEALRERMLNAAKAA